MGKKRSSKHLIISVMATMILILDSKTALAGTYQGVELCIRTVIPSLFSFFVLSVLLASALLNNPIPFLRPLGKLCGIPAGAEGLFLLGLVGGYPVGAQAVTQAWEAGSLSTRDAKRMLGFCNNCGPSFLFGITATLFQSAYVPWFLWGIHLLSAIVTGILLPGKSKKSIIISDKAISMDLPKALKKGTQNLVSVCGWILLARCVVAYLEKWILFSVPTPIQIVLYGFLELTNGCVAVLQIPSEYTRFLIVSAFLAFGGICVGLQTVSVTWKLKTGWYFPGKLLQLSLSLFLADIFAVLLYPQARLHPVLLLLPGIACVIIAGNRKKEVAIWPNILYNGGK